jgi:hypothetical protein
MIFIHFEKWFCMSKHKPLERFVGTFFQMVGGIFGVRRGDLQIAPTTLVV